MRRRQVANILPELALVVRLVQTRQRTDRTNTTQIIAATVTVLETAPLLRGAAEHQHDIDGVLLNLFLQVRRQRFARRLGTLIKLRMFNRRPQKYIQLGLHWGLH